MHTTLKEKAAKIRIYSADMLPHLLIFSPLILGKNLLFHWKIQSSLETEHSVIVNLFWEPTNSFFHITVLMEGIIPHQAYMTCNDAEIGTFVNCFICKYQSMKVTSSKHGKEKALLTNFVETACIVVPLPEAHQEPAGCSCTGTGIYITSKIRDK